MVAEKINFIPSENIDIDDIQEYYSISENTVNNLEFYDIPRMQKILNEYTRVLSKDQPLNPFKGMAWFKLFD